jgi:hypothetical protein
LAQPDRSNVPPFAPSFGYRIPCQRIDRLHASAPETGSDAIEYAATQIACSRHGGLVLRQLIGPDNMIEFPNHSRSYDRTRRAVRFWGHDSAIEASFFINEDALKRIQPDTGYDESGFLHAFDFNRDLICAAAAKMYVRGSRGSYDLVAANF